ncbi:MAG: FmdB family zinc ribbon protein [Candidatus Glassbacteria bacterium]
MPTYVYRCEACGVRFEKFHGINESPCFQCPTCSGRLVREISGGSGFLFRGSGFYATDYRSESYRSAEKKEKEMEKGGKSQDEGPGEKGKGE